MAYFWICLIFLASVRNSVSVYNPYVCEIFEESYGLIPPPLPTNFELKGEHVDHQEKYAVYEEMYFDHINSRAKFMYLLNTVEYHYLFDYDSQQIVQWVKLHPGTSLKRDPLSFSCEAVDMDDSDLTNIFGNQDAIYLRPKMFNANQVLRYGGQYLYAANGTTKLFDRNIQTNKFVGCVYDNSMDATLLNDYYFADTNIVQPSGGTPSSIVTGSSGKSLSIPVKLHMTGLRNEGEKTTSINKTINISWFKGEPQFAMETFQIPPWIHCNDYHKQKQMPKFPTAFSTRVVVTKFSVDTLGELQKGESSESYEEIYYDADKRLTRRDFTPVPGRDTDINSVFGNYAPVSTVYDFNEGLVYIINKPSGRCYIRPMQKNEFFDTEEDIDLIKLGTPEEIFLMQMDDMQYKGQAVARDIQCDVWNGQHTHKLYDRTFIKETYFSTDGWHELTEEMSQYNVPVRHVIIGQQLDDTFSRHISVHDFLKFKGRAPKIDSFDIKNCVEQINHLRFGIELAVTSETREQIFKYKFHFLEAAQLYIANKSEVNTPLRVQRLHLRHLSPSSERVFLVFSLLDKVDLSRLPSVVGQKGEDLQSAIYLLQKVVDNGKFVVEFKDPSNSKESIITVSAESGSLYSLTASGSFTKTPVRPAKSLKGEKTAILSQNAGETKVIEEETVYEEHNGMRTGSLVLVAFAMLFIGVGIGIAIMYLYIRMYGERHIESKINLTYKAGPSSEDIADEGSV